MKLTLKLYFILIMSVISTTNILFGQNSRVPIKFWGLQSFGGVVGVEGEYQTQDIKLP